MSLADPFFAAPQRNSSVTRAPTAPRTRAIGRSGCRASPSPRTAAALAEARSRTAPVRLVQRAQVLVAMLDEPEIGAMDAGRRAGFSGQSGCTWVKRFNEGGLAVLEDAPRGGRPPTHPPEVCSQLVSLALQKPRSVGLAFELWTLERLQREFKAREGVHLSDSTIWTWLDEEGLQWKRQQSWFHEAENHDAEFVEKRGSSSERTRRHRRGVE